MEEIEFTEDEIREQLEILGYSNVPQQRLQEFKRDLFHLVKHEKSKNSSLFSTSEQSSSSDSEAQRARHAMNSHSRPFYDENHRPGPSGSNSTGEHPRHGKENIFITAPSVPGENSKHTRHTEALSHDDNDPTPTYTLYNEGNERLHNDLDEDTTLDSTTSTERRVMKRKTLRKHNGQSEIIETESESGDLESLQERLRSLPISVHIKRPSTAPGYRPKPSEPPCVRPQSARDYTPAYRLPEDYDGLTALIKPMRKEPHTKNIKKSDPVSKYQKYRTSWDSYRAPGEKQHKGIRWGIREQMLYHDQVVDKKQHKIFVPNNYKVPSDKKRKNLRWQIRNDLAQGVVPPSMFE